MTFYTFEEFVNYEFFGDDSPQRASIVFQVGNRVNKAERERLSLFDVVSEAGGFIEFFMLALAFLLSSH